MENPLVSLIVPTFNASQFLEKLFDTISKIDYEKLECIFVDNNSIDNTFELIQGFIENSERHSYKLDKEEQRGACFARNRGIEIAQGELIAFLDADDWMAPQKISDCVKIFKNSAVDFVFSRGFRKYDNGKELFHPIDGIMEGENNQENLSMIWLKSVFHLQHLNSLICKMEVFQEIKGFPPLSTGEDWIFQVKLAKRFKGYFYNKVDTIYFRHSNSTMSQLTLRARFEEQVKQNLYLWQDQEIIDSPNHLAIVKSNLLILYMKGMVNGFEETAKTIDNTINIPWLIGNFLSLNLMRRSKTIFRNPFYWIWKFNEKVKNLI